MRSFIGKYELEVRLGLLFIVVLLLLLNISTAYVLYSVKNQLTAEADNRLGAGLNHTRQYLTKNRLGGIGRDQADLLSQRFGITGIGTLPVPDGDIDTLTYYLSSTIVDNQSIPKLQPRDIERLLKGENLFSSGGADGSRVGLTLAKISPGNRLLIYSRAESYILETISRAARTTLFLAVAVLFLTVPAVIILPRQILKPFKKMRKTAQSAGRLIRTPDSDEVVEVIKSYENIIDELRRNKVELQRLYHESSSKADKLEKLNRYILKSIGSGIINIDLGGKVIGYNRTAIDILGYDEEMVLGKYYLVAFPNEIEFGLLIEAGLERGEVYGRKEIELKRPGQSDLLLGVESSIILDDNERGVGVTLLVTDLTELKKLQIELETNRRLAALGEMTGGLAHQLRNSLAAISGFCQLLQKKTGKDSDIGEIAGSIRTEAADSETMVSRFLTFAKPLCLTNEMFCLSQLANECIGKFTADAAERRISLDLQQPVEEISIIGDLLLLREAICNVIANALDAAGIGGRVNMGIEPSDSDLNITIADNGHGIAENIKDKLFTPFVSSKPSGTGLGLALSRKIVNLHGGNIVFEPNFPQGTICRILLPNRVSIETPGAIPATAGAKKQ